MCCEDPHQHFTFKDFISAASLKQKILIIKWEPSPKNIPKDTINIMGKTNNSTLRQSHLQWLHNKTTQ